MHIHQEIDRQPGPEIVIDCPVCHMKGVSAATFDQRTRERLFGMIPLNDIRSSRVICSNCRAPIRSKLPVDQLQGLARDELTEILDLETSFLQKALAIIALLVAIFPGVGPVVAALALLVNLKLPCWPRTVSYVAVGLSLLSMLFCGCIVALDATGHWHPGGK